MKVFLFDHSINCSFVCHNCHSFINNGTFVLVKLTYAYRLNPTPPQRTVFKEWLELCRRQYNYRLGERFNWYESTRSPVNACPLIVPIQSVEQVYQNIPEFRVQTRDGKHTKKGDIHPNLKGGWVEWKPVQMADLKNTKAKFSAYKKLHSQVLQNVVERVEYAFSRFTQPDKNGNRSGKPKFKGIPYYKSFTYTQLNHAALTKDERGRDCIDLPKIGLVRIILHRPLPKGFKVKTGTIKQEADGWYISLSLEDTTVPQVDAVIHPTEQNSLGIDLGLERFLTTSKGEFIEVPQFLRQSEKRLAKLQAKREQYPKGSKLRRILNKRIAKLHLHIRRQRQNFHFEVAYWLFAQADVIFVEDLSLRNLIRRNKPKPDGQGGYLPNGQSARSGLNKSFSDAALGQFVQILSWVAWKLGKRVIKVDPWGTSQYCNVCLSHVPKALGDRWHSCLNCSESVHRDHNSGKLIQRVGMGTASLKKARKGNEAHS